MGVVSALQFVVFDAADRCLFRQYLGLKHRVFVEEFGWRLPANSEPCYVDADRFDPDATFFGLIEADRLVGVCRCSAAIGDYPYAALLDGFIRGKGGPGPGFAVLTAYALVREYRGRPATATGPDAPTTMAQALFVFLVAHLAAQGVAWIVLSAGVERSEKAFARWGFQPISGVIELEGAPIPVRNYAFGIPGSEPDRAG